MYLVWLHLKLDEQVLASISRDVVFENLEATRAANADIPVIFLSLTFCRPQKVAYVVFAQILIKSMHVYIIHIHVYMEVTRPRVHYRVITLVSLRNGCLAQVTVVSGN
jgi:hypothetical protein